MIIPAEHHERAVTDSRGLPYGVIEAPKGDGLIQIAGRYLAAPDCPRTAPCHVCGTVQPVVLDKARGKPYAICPAAEAVACIKRGQAKAAAERAAQVATAAIAGSARAQEEAAAKPGGRAAAKPGTRTRSRAERVTQARKTLLGQQKAATT